MEEFKTENLDKMKIIYTEHISPLCKFSPEIVIGEPDTFILGQLVKLRDLEFLEAHSLVNSIHINTSNFIFFALMNENMKKIFIELREEHLSHLGYPETEDFIIDFIIIFLEDCLKRAKDKAIK